MLFLSPKSRLLFPTAKQECSWFPEFAIPFQAFSPIHILNCVFSIMAGKSLKNQLKFQPILGSYLWFKFSVPHPNFLGFSGISMVENRPANAGDTGSIPGSGRPPEKEMATHSSILAWEITWTEEPGGLQFMGSQSVRHDLQPPTTAYCLCVWICISVSVCVCAVACLHLSYKNFHKIW